MRLGCRIAAGIVCDRDDTLVFNIGRDGKRSPDYRKKSIQGFCGKAKEILNGVGRGGLHLANFFEVFHESGSPHAFS